VTVTGHSCRRVQCDLHVHWAPFLRWLSDLSSKHQYGLPLIFRCDFGAPRDSYFSARISYMLMFSFLTCTRNCRGQPCYRCGGASVLFWPVILLRTGELYLLPYKASCNVSLCSPVHVAKKSETFQINERIIYSRTQLYLCTLEAQCDVYVSRLSALRCCYKLPL
jgi:hypothetical protein